MKISGFGTVTKKGLEIFKYCKLNAVALEFNEYYATSSNVALSTLADSNNATYSNIVDKELEDILDGASETYAIGNISASESYSSSDQTTLPLLMSLVSNDYTEDLNIYTIFLTAKDPTSLKISVPSGTASSYAEGNVVEDLTTFATGTIQHIDTTNDILYVRDIELSTSGATFVVGNTIRDNTTLASQTMSVVADCHYVVYTGCPAVDERQDIWVADPSSFTAVTGYISNSAGASALIDSIVGNKLTVERKNVLKFSRGDGVDNTATYVATETEIVADPKLNLTASSILPLPYVSDGSDILMRITLRYSSGFPDDICFPNSAITEIEEHNNDTDESHVDMRLQMLVNMSIERSDIRKNKQRIDAIVYRNSLLDEV